MYVWLVFDKRSGLLSLPIFIAIIASLTTAKSETWNEQMRIRKGITRSHKTKIHRISIK